jgi:hypothetical protein
VERVVRLSVEQWRRIVELHEDGESLRVIAAEVGTSKDSVMRALRHLDDASRGQETPGVQEVWQSWPPPLESSTSWWERWDADGSTVWLRQVRLWGSWVWVDEAGLVFCEACLHLVPVEVLGTPGNGHGASPWPSSRGLLPMPQSSDEVPSRVGGWVSEGAPW